MDTLIVILLIIIICLLLNGSKRVRRGGYQPTKGHEPICPPTVSTVEIPSGLPLQSEKDLQEKENKK